MLKVLVSLFQPGDFALEKIEVLLALIQLLFLGQDLSLKGLHQ